MSGGGSSSLQAVDVRVLKGQMGDGGAVVIDVRTPEEYATGHVPGALSFPLDGLEARLKELAPHKNRSLYVICATGGRSAIVQRLLAEAGFLHPINVEGGTRAWIAAGLPVE